MGNITKVVEEIVNNTNKVKKDLDQVSMYDATLRLLGETEKPTYDLPLADTLGKQTYPKLNRKIYHTPKTMTVAEQNSF